MNAAEVNHYFSATRYANARDYGGHPGWMGRETVHRILMSCSAGS